MALVGGIIAGAAWAMLGAILAFAYIIHRSHRENSMDNIMGRCPGCGRAITARISEDHPHALADSVLAHVCPEPIAQEHEDRIRQEYSGGVIEPSAPGVEFIVGGRALGKTTEVRRQWEAVINGTQPVYEDGDVVYDVNSIYPNNSGVWVNDK